MNLEEVRTEINEIDKELVRLIEKRMTQVVLVGEYKMKKNIPVLDSKREEIVLKKVSSLVKNKSFDNSIVEIFQAMMTTAKKYQEQMIKENH